MLDHCQNMWITNGRRSGLYNSRNGNITLKILLIILRNLKSCFQTNELSSMYYASTEWNRIIEKSNNVEENLKLMKLVLLSMQLNVRPLKLTGLNFFDISLHTVITVRIRFVFFFFLFLKSFFLQLFQGGFSYFTFLTKTQ